MDTTARLRRLRMVAAAGSALVVILYLLTGLGVVSVVAEQEPGVVPPLLIAAVVFAVLALLLPWVAKRWLWFTAAVLQVGLIAMYVVVAADRTPAFEAWGVTVKALQVALLAAFMWLVLRRHGRLDASGAAT